MTFLVGEASDRVFDRTGQQVPYTIEEPRRVRGREKSGMSNDSD